MRQLIVTIIAASVVCACAGIDTKADQKEEKEIITGSNIPRKDRSATGVTVSSREALENMQRQSGGPTVRGSENPR